MNRIPVQSSNILSVGYDNLTHVLEIEFRGGKAGPPKVYRYFEVPSYVYDDLLAGGFGSVGRYFREAVVKSNYKYQEIKEEVKMESEEKSCNECREQWIDTGDDQCPFCGSSNIEPVDDEEDTNDDPDPLAA